MPYTPNGKNKMLDALAPVTVSLHTATPNDSGSNEVTDTGSPPAGYARQSITFGAAAAGSIDSSSTPVFDVPAGVTVTHVGFWDGASPPVFLGYADVTDEAFGADGTYTLSDADLDLNS